MESILFTLWMTLLGPVILFFVVRKRTFRKMLCELLEADGSIRSRLVRVEGEFLNIEGERYIIDSTKIRWKRHPAGWPTWIQQTVPTSLYRVGESGPIDWMDPSKGGVTAGELSAIMEPHWIRVLVRGVREGDTGSGKENRMMSMVAVGAGVLSLVLMAYVISRLAILEGIIKTVGGG